MNWELIKHKFCRLAVTASLLLGGVMVSAAASGTMPLWAALLGLFAAVVMLNAACGILLGTPAALSYNCALCAAGTLPESAYPYLL